MSGKYDDIIDLPHHQSTTHPHMSDRDRAAQFAPFQSLNGYGAVITEAARDTREKIAIGEDAAALIGERLQIIDDNISAHPEVEVTYFLPDARKSGGEYVTEKLTVREIDGIGGRLVADDGKAVAFDDIISIDGEIFERIIY